MSWEGIQRWALAPLRGERYTRDVPVPPEVVRQRLAAAVGNRPKRALGVLKVGPAWAGVVTADEFLIWEKQEHATRAHGRFRGRRGGTRVVVDIEVSGRTRVLMVVFFGLLAVASIGMLSREGGFGFTPSGLAIAALGAFVMLSLFWSASLRQRAALRAFLDHVLVGERAPGT